MHAADGVFVSLAALVRGDAPPAAELAPEPAAPFVDVPTITPAQSEAPEWLRDVRLFRARLADALDDARDGLLRELAYAVLGRELLLGPGDVAAIAQRVLAEHDAAQTLRLRVAPDDLGQLAPHADALPAVSADASLAPGDVIVELQHGTVDARIGARLAAVLSAFE